MKIEICNVIKFENIIEVGYIREYPVNVEDYPDLGFPDEFVCYNFYNGAFVIKNLPTPFFLRDEYPAINVEFWTGNGGRDKENDVDLKMPA